MHNIAIIGTRAQAIKMAPVVHALRHEGLACHILLSGQHKDTVVDLLADFQLEPDIVLSDAHEVATIAGGLAWLPKVLYRCYRYLSRTHTGSPPLVLVHGDTVTTLIGTLAGRLSGCRIAHVEAGLRSGSIRDPFPEEFIRRITTRLAHVAYCPGPEYVEASRGPHRSCIDTMDNTVLDAVRWALHSRSSSPPAYSSIATASPYIIVSAHRLETVMVSSRLRALFDLVRLLARDVDVKFVLHPVTRNRLQRSGLLQELESTDRVELLPRMTYCDFITFACGASAVLTDGGGNQEEMSYLGIPTLLLRRRTERMSGLGGTARLVGLDPQAVKQQLGTIRAPTLTCEEAIEKLPRTRPSKTIAADIACQAQSSHPAPPRERGKSA